MLPFEKIHWEIKKLKTEKTDPKFGCNPYERPIKEHIKYSVVNIDKPRGPSSHQVSSYVKKILNLEKCGHSGTLDPGVTGVLPVATGRATRIVQLLLKAGKVYVGIMHLHDDVSDEKLEKTRLKFVGKITQLPPVKSAVKRELRDRIVYEFEFIERKNKDILFKVSCQAGTYIRKLIHDLGKEVGGAHMVELRRIQAGPFKEDKIFTLHDLKDAYHYYEEGQEELLRQILLPVEAATEHLPKVWVLDSAVESICHGVNLHVPGVAKLHKNIKNNNLVAVMTLKDELVCYGRFKTITKPKGTAVDVEKVFMEPGTYPRITQQ